MNLSPKPSSEPGPASPTPISRGHRWLLLILVVLLPLYGFGCLAEALRNRGGLGWDTSALTFVHKHDSPELDRILILITQTGDLRLVLIVTVVCAAVLLLARRKLDERFFGAFRCRSGSYYPGD